MDEKELLEYLCKDAALGIELAIAQYGKAVKTICQSVLSGYSMQDIEETVSDTFVALWKSRSRIVLKEGVGLKGYLYGIARKTAFNRRRILAKEHPTQDIMEAEDMASDENIEESVLRKSEYQVLYQLINSMKSPDREIFIYRYFYQNSIKEIAQILAIKAKTVENRLTRGRNRLKKQLIQSGIEVA